MKSLKSILQKNPGYVKYFEKLNDINDKLDKVEEVYNRIIQYKQLFSNLFDTKFNSLEELSDFVENKIIETNKINFVKQFISNKYKHLINNETIELFDLIRKEYSDKHDQVQSLIMKKIASFKTSNDFNTYIKDVIDSLQGEYTVSNLEQKITSCGGIVEYKNDSIIVCSIPDFKTMQRLGSDNWCIKRDEYFFQQYVCAEIGKVKKLDYNKQLIIFDTNYSRIDPNSMVGVTISYEGYISAAHLKDDTNFKHNVTDRYGFIKDLINDQVEYIRNKPKSFYDQIYFNEIKVFKWDYRRFFHSKHLMLKSSVSGNNIEVFNNLNISKDQAFLSLDFIEKTTSVYIFKCLWLVADLDTRLLIDSDAYFFEDYMIDLYDHISTLSEKEQNHLLSIIELNLTFKSETIQRHCILQGYKKIANHRKTFDSKYFVNDDIDAMLFMINNLKTFEYYLDNNIISQVNISHFLTAANDNSKVLYKNLLPDTIYKLFKRFGDKNYIYNWTEVSNMLKDLTDDAIVSHINAVYLRVNPDVDLETYSMQSKNSKWLEKDLN